MDDCKLVLIYEYIKKGQVNALCKSNIFMCIIYVQNVDVMIEVSP